MNERNNPKEAIDESQLLMNQICDQYCKYPIMYSEVYDDVPF